MTYQITTQKELRRLFWNSDGDQLFQARRKRLRNGDYSTDARCAFVDYIDHCVREGIISESLAQRATL